MGTLPFLVCIFCSSIFQGSRLRVEKFRIVQSHRCKIGIQSTELFLCVPPCDTCWRCTGGQERTLPRTPSSKGDCCEAAPSHVELWGLQKQKYCLEWLLVEAILSKLPRRPLRQCGLEECIGISQRKEE